MTSPLASKIHLLLPRLHLTATVKYLKANGPENCSYVELPIEDDAAIPAGHREELRSAEVLLTTSPLLGALLYSLPRLQWAQLTFAGVDKLMKCYQSDKPEPPFAVTRFASAGFSRELAEWVLTAVLSHERGFHRLWAAQRQHSWAQQGYTYRPMSEVTVAVLGTGQMGSQVGLLFKQLGCTVNGLSRTEKPPSDIFDNMFCLPQLQACLQSADYICSLLPSTPQTAGLLTPTLLAELPRRPVLVSAGRGDLVHERHLVQALRRGWLAGAVLDVFETEPLPADSPLWDMEQVTISPHVGNLSRPEEVCRTFLDNLQRYRRGEPLLHRVDWRRGY